jgi:hypothetical protein
MDLKETITKVRSKNPPSIDNKTEFYKLYRAGIFGNKARSWDNYEDLMKSGYKGKISIRSKVGIDRKKVKYNLPLKKVKQVIEKWKEKGIKEDSITFNEAMPDKHLIIQGEVRELEGTFYLRYSTKKIPMLKAFLTEDLSATNLKAKMILKGAMDESSYADLEALLEIYPENTIEFSTYSFFVGNIPGRNTVFWEVRNY